MPKKSTFRTHIRSQMLQRLNPPTLRIDDFGYHVSGRNNIDHQTNYLYGYPNPLYVSFMFSKPIRFLNVNQRNSRNIVLLLLLSTPLYAPILLDSPNTRLGLIQIIEEWIGHQASSGCTMLPVWGNLRLHNHSQRNGTASG